MTTALICFLFANIVQFLILINLLAKYDNQQFIIAALAHQLLEMEGKDVHTK